MKRVLSKSGHAKTTNEPRQYTYADTDDSKARHILGLDMTHLRPSRRNSSSSTSTNKLRSVTFSNATTAAVTVTDSSQSERGTPISLSRKASSPLLRRNKRNEISVDGLKAKGSSSSLRSFYDKSRTPLAVSQQTSESSRRDFALRKGAPSIVSASSQETEHSRQVHLMTKSHASPSKDRNRLAPSVMKMSNSSSRSLVPSMPDTTSDTMESLSSQPSGSRISILRNSSSRLSVLSPVLQKLEDCTHPARVEVDPARAKINVKRPKAGTKNWFDSLDTDSSDDEVDAREPHLTDEFALDMASTLNHRQPKKVPSSSKIQLPAELPSETTHNCQAAGESPQARAELADSVTPTRSQNKRQRKRKINVFENIDLNKQSILDLEPSDDEDHFESSKELSDVSEISVVGADRSRNDAQVDIAQTISTRQVDSRKASQHLQKTHLVIPQLPKRVSSRMITYLEDCSTETVTQQEDLLTSFPQTPTDTHSRSSSIREYLASEDEATASTKLMTVTRQEESLIAAMRLKKTAMKRAQAFTHRQSALNNLERNSSLGNTRLPKPGIKDGINGANRHHSPMTQSRPQPPVAYSQRTDSVTTFQTDSMRQPSVRSSIATYLSEGSEDLQLPYSTTDGLPMGSSRLRRAASTTSDRPRSDRDTFLSELSMSTYTASPSEWSANGRDNAGGGPDVLDHQMHRGEIPSQLFLERPFLGWEAQASMQSAH